MPNPLSHLFCVAPMIDWTDKHCRYFHRLLSQHALLYTEMITTGAILFGDRERFLSVNPVEHPIALQLGGADPKALAECASIGESYGYDEINMNVGCPSDRVQSGKFGACLMAEPNLVGDCIAAMQAKVKIPVTVKTRIGIDDSAEKDFLWRFIEIVKTAGCQTFIIHARKAWLKGLSPKENREIPPLRYEIAAALKKDFSDLEIILNGGILTLEEGLQHLESFDGIMLGRAAYHNPYLLSEVDAKIFASSTPQKTRQEIIHKLIPYCEQQMQQGTPLHAITRHILGLWHGEPGARKIRQVLSDHKISETEKLSFLLSLN
ncbi:MAG: dusA [Gammaproteobacteria bacterium]|jgi:tRNA-dihydrouridine synthase A|nr:dusA [Gammaproteobacteria bacterium]